MRKPAVSPSACAVLGPVAVGVDVDVVVVSEVELVVDDVYGVIVTLDVTTVKTDVDEEVVCVCAKLVVIIVLKARTTAIITSTRISSPATVCECHPPWRVFMVGIWKDYYKNLLLCQFVTETCKEKDYKPSHPDIICGKRNATGERNRLICRSYWVEHGADNVNPSQETRIHQYLT